MKGGSRLVGAFLATALLGLGPVTAFGSDTILYPGVASLAGANGTAWRSQLTLYNPGKSGITASLSLVPRGSSSVVAERQYTLAAGETLQVDDVYAALGAADGAGVLRVSGGALAWIRTFNQTPSGTFGQGVPAVLQSTGLTGQAIYFPVKTAADIETQARSNLILENLENRATTVVVRSGSVEKSWTIEPGTMMQINRIGRQLGLAGGSAVLAVTGDGRWAGYVATVDPISGDPTTVLGRRLSEEGTVLFTGVAHLQGANGTQWRSELFLHNPGQTSVQARLSLVPRDSSTIAAQRGLELQPGETVFWNDVYGEMGVPEGAGTLSVDGPVLAWVRTYNRQSGGATNGQPLPLAVPGSALAPGEEILFPVSNPEDPATGFRSNLIVQNLSQDQTACTLRTGTSSSTISVPAGTYVQYDNVPTILRPIPPAGEEMLTLSCDQEVSAFVTTIDPLTGDPTTVLGFHGDELELVPPRIVVQPQGGTVPAGSFQELHVDVEGRGPLSYQWFLGPVGDRSNPVPGAVEDHMIAGPVESAESYWVEVENAGGRTSSTGADLVVDSTVTPVPSLSPPPGTYPGPVEVHLACGLAGARIHYTVDGSTPTMDSPVYGGETLLASGHVTAANDPDPGDEYVPLTTYSLRILAFAEADGLAASPVVEGDYVVDAVDTAFYLPYNDPPAAGGTKHTLDVYQPHGRSGTPVLFFVHGGAWKQGDKNIYVELGNTFAGYYGFTTVIINYEISTDPWNAVFPEHIDDVADAFAWTYAHIANFGGDPQRIWLFGQSAGGHLVSLLATDGAYLRDRGLSTDIIRGTVSMSGAYDLYDMVKYPMNPLGLSPAEVLEYKALMTLVFGSYDEAVLDLYSPSEYASSAQPPFRLIWAWDDMPGFPEEGQRFFDQVSALGGPPVDKYLLLESDIPQPVLDLDFDGHHAEIYAINTRDWDSVSTRAVANLVDPTVPFPEMDR